MARSIPYRLTEKSEVNNMNMQINLLQSVFDTMFPCPTRWEGACGIFYNGSEWYRVVRCTLYAKTPQLSVTPFGLTAEWW